MGKTLVVFKITLDEMDYISEVMASIQKIQKGEVKDIQKFPIGFGIEIIKTAILIPEKQDQVLDEVTQELQQIPHVENVEIETMTLL